MESVIFEKDDQTFSTICIVENLSEDLKEIIRKQLSSICHGATIGESGKKSYSYHNTLREFLKRYDTKSESTKKGMIGELLSHVLFIEFFREFQIISPFFNLEERSIKKSFDILLYSSDQKNIYYTEVKSGNAKDEKSDDKNITLLGIAKSDIQQKLNDNNDNNWLNAINGAKISLEKKNIKNEVIEILENCLEDSQESNLNSKGKSVILVSVTYNSISDKITLSRVKDYSTKNAKDFCRCILFSIQNETYQSIESFLRAEVANGN